MKRLLSLPFAILGLAPLMEAHVEPTEERRNHIVMIMVDDLNDFIEPLALKNPDGSPRRGNIVAQTPNMTRLAESGVLFTNAHSNSPVCNPSRTTMMHGVLPSTARFYGFENRLDNPVFSGTKTLPKLMNTIPEGETVGAYRTFYTGKTFHVNAPSEYERTNGIKPSQMPRPFNTATGEYVGLPTYPQDNYLIDGQTFFEAFGQLDSVYGSLELLNDYPDIAWARTNKDGVNRYATDLSAPSTKFQGFYPDYANMTDVYDPAKKDLLYYVNDDDRDLMIDELSARYFETEIDIHFSNNGQKARPIFMAFGIMNPHTPMVAPQSYFDMYPLESLDLSFLVGNDQSMVADPNYSSGRGNRLYRYLVEAYNDDPNQTDKILELKKYLQAYLACTTHADDQIGKVLDYLETKIDPNTGEPMINNTTIVLFADHGYHLGQKEYAWKYSMWDDSSRVPLIISDPRYPSTYGEVIDLPVSLVDIYPTIVELGDMEWALDTQITSPYGLPLDGTSLVPFLENPETSQETWGGLPVALTMADTYVTDTPRDQIAAIRSTDFRYIRYGSAQDTQGNYLYEEFYDYRTDPLELNNIILDSELYATYEAEIERHRIQMNDLLSNERARPWEGISIPGEKFIAGFHTFQDSNTPVALSNRTADDSINPALIVTASHGPSNDFADIAFHGENVLDYMVNEFSTDSTYGSDFPLLSTTGPIESSLVLDAQPENYVLFKFENTSTRSFQLTSLQFDAQFENTNLVSAFTVGLVNDPDRLLGNGLAPQRSQIASGAVPFNSGINQFDSITVNLATAAPQNLTIAAGETRYYLLTVISTGFAAQALTYMDNIAWVGTEVDLPLNITEQPVSATGVDGESVSLSSNAEGDNLQFQWYRGQSGVTTDPVPNATNRSLTFLEVEESDEGDYWVRVFNSSESANSTAASLTVNHPVYSDTTLLAGWHTPATLSGQFSVGANAGSPEVAHLGIADVEWLAQQGRRAGGISGSTAVREAANSSDNTIGSFPMDPSDLPTSTVSFELDRGNASNRYLLDLIVTNNRSTPIALEHIRFDYRRNSATTPDETEVIYATGDLIGVASNTTLASLSGYEAATWHNIDISLSTLADRTLGPGESVSFQINMGFDGTVSGNDGIFIDNLGLTGTFVESFSPVTAVNTAPVFSPDSMIVDTATIGELYSRTLKKTANDADGDPLSFTKTSGPSWLTVSTDGQIEGTPSASDVGLNRFIVSVDDGRSATGTASVDIPVVSSNPDSDGDDILDDYEYIYFGDLTSTEGNRSNADGDAFTDAQESVFGTDPLSPDSQFEQSFRSFSDGFIDITFDGVAGNVYTLEVRSDLSTGDWEAVDSVTTTAYGPQYLYYLAPGNPEELFARVSVTAAPSGPINQAPAFNSNTLSKTNAFESTLYNDSLANDAFDPEDDTLTFSKISGPSWLNIASDGTLSGTPAFSDVGTNTFSIEVSATGGSDTAELSITVEIAAVNQAPFFSADPLNKTNGIENVAYNGSLSGDATDPENDTLTFSKVSGPDWLTVGSDGTLSGTPSSSNIGANAFVVRVDATGGFDTANMNITVGATPTGELVEIQYDDFEGSGAGSLGNWTIGGTSILQSGPRATEGNYCISIRGSDGIATSNTLAVAGYSQIEIAFGHESNGMEVGDSFELQLSTNGGASFMTLESWTYGTEILAANAEAFDTITHTGTLTNQTIVRFVSTSDNSGDKAYVDQIRISVR